MAKNKRKLVATVQRTQGPLYALVPSHTNQGGSHLPNPYLSLYVVILTSSAGPSTVKEEDGSLVANGSTSLDGFFVDGCSDEEEQLDFTFSEEEYEKC
jgi:hypothetical protein